MKVELHLTAYKRPHFEYNFLFMIISLIYLQTYKNWKLRIIDQSDGDLDELKLFRNVPLKLLDNSKIEFSRSPRCENDSLCKRRQLLADTANCDIIINIDDDDIYPPTYIQDIINYYKTHSHIECILNATGWRYNINSRKYLRYKDYSGGSQWSFRHNIFTNPEIKFCHGYCKDPNLVWPHRHPSGACAEWQFKKEIIAYKIKHNDHDPYENDSIRISHDDNERGDGSWQNDEKDFGSTLDNDYKWLISNIPPRLRNYYVKNILEKCRAT